MSRTELEFCHGEKGCHEMEQLRQDNQQETCPRRSVVLCCFPCSNPWSAWASKRRCPGEALLLVVKVVQVVFPCVHVDSAGENVGDKTYRYYDV